MPKKTARLSPDDIPDVEGREFERELPFVDPGVTMDQTPLTAGRAVMVTQTAQLIADRKTFPRFLRRMLESAGFSQNALAAEMGISKQAVWQLVNGYRVNPSFELILRYAAACGCRILIEYPRRVHKFTPSAQHMKKEKTT